MRGRWHSQIACDGSLPPKKKSRLAEFTVHKEATCNKGEKESGACPFVHIAAAFFFCVSSFSRQTHMPTRLLCLGAPPQHGPPQYGCGRGGSVTSVIHASCILCTRTAGVVNGKKDDEPSQRTSLANQRPSIPHSHTPVIPRRRGIDPQF